MQVAFFGLGKMGKNMVYRLIEHEVEVFAWNRSPQPREDVVGAGARPLVDFATVRSLSTPRIVWLMLPNGAPTDEVLQNILPHLDPGDIVIDGANSKYTDSLARFQLLASHSVRFIDVGVSGGPDGARNGACLMIGGDEADVSIVDPIFRALAAPNAYAHLGPVGSGHFAKMIHNGIEYGMMQAIAEGAAVLKASPFTYDLAKVMNIYNNRSVIESRLVGWAEKAFSNDAELTQTSSKINHTGEGEWTVLAAREYGVDVPVIEESLDIREKSSDESNLFRDKVVSALRHQFGGHDVSKSS